MVNTLQLDSFMDQILDLNISINELTYSLVNLENQVQNVFGLLRKTLENRIELIKSCIKVKRQYLSKLILIRNQMQDDLRSETRGM